MRLIDEAIEANVIKSIIFNGKVAYRILKTASVTDDTIFVPETQENDSNNEHNTSTIILEESQTSQVESNLEHQRKDDENININNIIENKIHSYVEVIGKRFTKIEDHLIGLCSSKSTTNSGNVSNNFCTELLKTRISELEKQLSEKNAIIDFLTTQLITNPPVTSTNNKRNNNDHHQITNGNKNKNKNSNHDDAPLEKLSTDETRNEVIIIGDSMLNNINSHGLSKSKKS